MMRFLPKPPPSAALDRASFIHVAVGVTAALLPVLPGFPIWLSVLLLAVVGLGTWLGLRNQVMPPQLRIPFSLGVAALAVLASGFSMSQQSGAALLAAMLASKLLETRTVRDGRSASSFALFSIMAGFLRDQGPLILFLALIAAICLMMALHRLAQVQYPEARPASAQPWPTLRASVRLLAVSLPFAFVVFFLFPRFANPLWGAPAPDEASASSGLSNDMSPGDIAQMLLDDSPALRVTFEGTPPPRNAMYWRGPVLSDFDGRRWSRWPGDAYTPAAHIENLGRTLFHEVMQEPTTHAYLIGLDVPVELPEYGLSGMDRTAYARRPSPSVRRYRIGSAESYVLQPELSITARRRNLNLPQNFNPRSAQLMAQWRAEDPSAPALIQRALTWFNREFTYTLTPPLLARDSVDDFLFGTRAGYCEHFASAFAVMMRQAGIPARVVTGYQGGAHNTIGDYWLIRNSDAHAWTEVWLEGQGWVRIDPTSAVAPERIQQGLSGITPQASTLSRWSQPLWDMTDALRRGWNYFVVDFNAARQRDLLARLGLDASDWRQIGAVLTISIGLAILLTFLLLWRAGPRRRQDPLLEAWQHFASRLARRAAQPKHESETALAFARRVAELLPEDAQTILALTQRYVAQRYAVPAPAAQADPALMAELQRFRPRSPAPRRSS